ncbi:hypothetical protein [Sphingorhabdus sp.]|uniref:hypothetical protein n=1 Tax=Sphingorhabdus sp. TaxID=1902408 RepID=UPI0032B82E9C
MHRLLIFALVGASCHVSVAANAASSTQDGSADRMVCKRYKQTGTRFENKVCKTAGEWDAIAEAHRRALAETVDRPQIKICGPSRGCD